LSQIKQKNQLLDSGELKSIYSPSCTVTVLRKHASMCKQQLWEAFGSAWNWTRMFRNRRIT